MAEDNAQVEQQAPKEAKSSGELIGISIVGKIVGVLVLVWLVSVSYYAFAFFVLGMLPSFLSIVIDRGSGRFASKTVCACNFIAIMPYLFDIVLTYDRSIVAKQFMQETSTWVTIYGFAAIGWMLIWIMPNVTMVIFAVRADVKTRRLKTEQAALLDEWGNEVRTGKKRGEL